MKKKVVKIEKKTKLVKEVEKINSAISGKIMNETGIVGDGALVK